MVFLYRVISLQDLKLISVDIQMKASFTSTVWIPDNTVYN